MRLTELEKFKLEFPKLDTLFIGLEDYFFSLSQKQSNPDIVPILLAHRLSINEGLALALLMLSDKAGLITPSYHVICKADDSVIAEFPTKAEIPKTVFCPYHNKSHNSEDYEVELVFHFTKLFKEKYSTVVA